VRNFSARTEALRELTKKSAEFKWAQECENEFNDIKQALTESPVMAYPDFDKEFRLETDASIKGLGAILSQEYPAGNRVVAYASRSLNEHEKRYSITKLEALGVVWATELFKIYLQDHPFELVTDHKALLKFSELKDTNPTLERWSIKLSQYNYRVTYRPGPKHENADCLSRSIGNISVEHVAQEQRNDPLMGQWFGKFDEMDILQPLDSDEKVLDMGKEAVVLKADGKLWRRTKVDGKSVDKLCVPRNMVTNVLAGAHNAHHLDFEKTLDRVSKFWWERQRKDVKAYVKSCPECQYRNTPKGFGNRSLVQGIRVERKFELVGVDLCKPGPKSLEYQGGEENLYVLVLTDYATKWTVCVPVKDKKPHTIAEAMWDRWITVYGCPERIISDNGGEFTSQDIVNELYKLFQIRHDVTTSYHPRANGQVERFNKTMVNMLAKKVWEDQTQWSKYLAGVQLEYNMTRHSTTRETPFFLVFGQEPRLPLEELLSKDLSKDYSIEEWKLEGIPTMTQRMRQATARMKKLQERNATRRNKSVRKGKVCDKTSRTFEEGDKILIRKEPTSRADIDEFAKLKSPWQGPYEIGRRNARKYPNSYIVIKDDGKEEIVNEKNIKHYYTRPIWMTIRFVPARGAEGPEDRLHFPEEEESEGEVMDQDIQGQAGEEAMNQDIQGQDKEIIQQPMELEVRQAPVESPVQSDARVGTRHSSRVAKWKPKINEGVDVKFQFKGKYVWCCGTVTKLGPADEAARAYVEFLDGKDGDWYFLRDESIRPCTPGRDHVRSAEYKIKLIAKQEGRKERRKDKRRTWKGVMLKETHRMGESEADNLSIIHGTLRSVNTFAVREARESDQLLMQLGTSSVEGSETNVFDEKGELPLHQVCRRFKVIEFEGSVQDLKEILKK
jgi:hypothetical protein